MLSVRMKRSRALRVAVAALACSAAAPSPARGQSVETVLRRVSARAGQAARGADNYTVELGFLEGAVTLYTARRSASDPFLVQYGAREQLSSFMTLLAFTDAILLALQEPNAATARKSLLSYGGVSAASGAPAHVVTANFPRRAADGTRSRVFVVHYDTATLLPRRMEMSAATSAGTRAGTTIDYSDYRAVDGLQVPFQRRMVTHGRRVSMDTARVRTVVTTLRAGLAQQPPAEREQVTRLITRLEGVLERDELVEEITVTSARVNQGPPSGVRLEPVEPLDP